MVSCSAGYLFLPLEAAKDYLWMVDGSMSDIAYRTICGWLMDLCLI